MPLKTMSLILYTAYQTMQPCDVVFQETAKAANPKIDFSIEQVQLEEFAKAACETSNPDMIWQIAQQETNFRFNIVRVNGKAFSIKEGEEAIRYLKKLKKKSARKDPPKMNVDIGVLQFNWNWHREGFENDPLQALSPSKQVAYFLDTYSAEIFRRCEGRWVGCYHNQSNAKIARTYEKGIKKRGKTLALQSLAFMRTHRQLLSAEAKENLPPLVKDEFYQVFNGTKTAPLPRKEINVARDEDTRPEDLITMVEGEG